MLGENDSSQKLFAITIFQKIGEVLIKKMPVAPKLVKERVTNDGAFADFGIDVEQDLIHGTMKGTKTEKLGRPLQEKTHFIFL